MADEYICKAEAIKQCGFGMTSLHIADNLRKMSPADVVPVVRCRDCKHWKSYYGRCYKHDEYGMASDDFCSYGERREE